MLPKDVEDNRLIEEIKKNHTNSYIAEAINRWSGAYVSVCQNYTYVPKFEMDQILENKNTNIYEDILKYDPSRNMKISTWISQSAKWRCQSKICAYQEPEQINEDIVSEENSPISENKEIINKVLIRMNNPRFAEIIRLRYFGNEVTPWKKLGKILNLSHERVRQVFLEGFPRFKKMIEIEMSKS
jgi:hypothetical protein